MLKQPGTKLNELLEQDLNRSRQELCNWLWRRFWCEALTQLPFCHSAFPSSQINLASSAAPEYRWTLHEFPPQPTSVPPGSVSERHEECMIIWRSLGPDLFNRVVEKTYDASFSKLMEEVCNLAGPDVYWSGHATFSSGVDQIPIAVPSKSQTHFGSLRICRFPFTVEFQFDDVPEKTTFSLASSIADDVFELLVSDLQLLVSENRDEKIMLKRDARRALRCLSDNSAVVEIEVKKLFGYAYLSGRVSIESDNHGESMSAADIPGFNVYIKETKVVRTKGPVCSCFVATGDLPLQQLTGTTPYLDLQSKTVTSIVEATPEQDLRNFLIKIEDLKSESKAEYRKKLEILHLSFYSSVFTNSDIALDRLHAIITEKYSTLSDIFKGRLLQDLLAYRTSISYLDRCSKAEVYWYLFWLVLLEGDETWIPKSFPCEPQNLDSILYKCHSMKTLSDLQSAGFSATALNSEPFCSFWVHLEMIRSKIFYKNINHLNDAITSVRLEASRCNFTISSTLAIGPREPTNISQNPTVKEPNQEKESISLAHNSLDEDMDDNLNDIVLQDFFEQESGSSEELGEIYGQPEGMIEHSQTNDAQKSNTSVVASQANGSPSESLARKKSAPRRIYSMQTNGNESDFDDMKMKFTLNRVKSLTSADKQKNSIQMQLHKQGETYRRSMNQPFNLDIVYEKDPKSGHKTKASGDEYVAEGSGESKSKESNAWDSDDSSLSESSSDSEDNIIEAEKSKFKALHLKIDDMEPNTASNVLCLEKKPSNRRNLLNSPVARVHRLEMRRRTRRNTALENVLNAVVPQCGPGRF